MEDRVDEGIFFHTNNIQCKSMVECLQWLHETYPDIKVSSVITDTKFSGFRVHFSKPEVKAMLEKKHILVTGRQISIYPLTTYLMIHNFSTNEMSMLKREFRDLIEGKFGKILKQHLIPGSGNQQDYLVLIDVPEVKDFDIFDSNECHEMQISFPNISKSFKVTFWCRRCTAHGHTQQECVQRIQSEISLASQEKKEVSTERTNGENKIEMNTRKHPSTIPINLTTQAQNSNASNLLDRFASLVGREQIMNSGFYSGLLNQEDQDKVDRLPRRKSESSNSANYEEISNVQIKQEIDEAPGNESTKTNNNSQNEACETNRNNQNISKTIKKEEPDTAKNQSLNNDNTLPFRPHVTDDDDVQIIESEESKSSDNVSYSNSNITFTKFGKKGLAAKGTDGSKESTIQPTTSNMFAWPTELPEASSLLRAVRQQPKPSTSVEITSCLSEHLEDCINRAYCHVPVLNRTTLDAFLIHVKKKSNPKRIASNYTTDVQGLKTQLQQILHYYYNTPDRGTKEDSQFIKWLKGLVERFEGTIPRKRKRPSKDDTESTTKK